MQYLRFCKGRHFWLGQKKGLVADLDIATDEKLRLLSPIVAAYVSEHTDVAPGYH